MEIGISVNKENSTVILTVPVDLLRRLHFVLDSMSRDIHSLDFTSELAAKHLQAALLQIEEEMGNDEQDGGEVD